MPIESRTRGELPGPGPYLARISNLLDPTFMGSVEVTLEKGYVGNTELQSQTYIVQYLSPFYGVTSVLHEGGDQTKFDDVQKSYGMWMIPPDIGTRVLVIFIDGDVNQGYWMGCIADKYQNQMIPGIAASQDVHITAEEQLKYGTKYLPVAEFHKRSAKENTNPNTQLKPIHPFADRLLAQGLLLDNIRGVTSSSARREIPSMVFGISTPGPLDSNGKKGQIGYEKKVTLPVSRLGGSQFVMDDGDVNGQNELVRIRTRTGHQILMHNSSDLIYVANSKGTAWIELTSSGKMDIYAEDSISLHTKGDFNLRADRDFNLEAGRNFNIATVTGEMNINVKTDFNIITDQMKTKVSGDYDLVTGDTIRISANGDINTSAIGTSAHVSEGKFSIGSEANICIGANDEISLGANGKIYVSGEQIHLNGAAAEAPDNATPAEQPIALNLYSVPQRDASTGWANKNFYKAPDILSIMQRIPSHEPWDQHENVDPERFTVEKTDTKIAPTVTTDNGVVIEAVPSANTPYPVKNGPAGDRGTLKGSKFFWTTDQPFLTKVKEVAGYLQFNPIDLLAIMNLESARSFDPAITNSLGYTGLIQFGKESAGRLGTSTDALRQMGRVEQMGYVQSYFNKLWGWPNAKQPSPTLGNIYLTVLLPAFRFAAPDDKIADATDPKTSGWYKANRGFDPTNKGFFTPAMVEATVLQHKREVLQALSNAGVGTNLIVP